MSFSNYDDPEEIVDVKCTIQGGWYPANQKPPFIPVRLQYTEADGLIRDLFLGPMAQAAIINGKPCSPRRQFTKESFDKVMKNFLEAL